MYAYIYLYVDLILIVLSLQPWRRIEEADSWGVFWESFYTDLKLRVKAHPSPCIFPLVLEVWDRKKTCLVEFFKQ